LPLPRLIARPEAWPLREPLRISGSVAASRRRRTATRSMTTHGLRSHAAAVSCAGWVWRRASARDGLHLG